MTTEPTVERNKLQSAWLWLRISLIVGVMSGISSFIFLKGLDLVTKTHQQSPWLVWLLPVAGVGMAAVYHFYDAGSRYGNDLILDRIHHDGGRVPLRMAPLILIATWVTHLFGGSAGREGTAVQMSGALGHLLVKPFRLNHQERGILLVTAIAGGFGAVFGTPIAGAVFAIEVINVSKFKIDALIQCLIASYVGHLTCTGLGIKHSANPNFLDFNWFSLGMLKPYLIASVLFGLTAWIFVFLTHQFQRVLKDHPQGWWIRPVLGGIGVIALTHWVGSSTYNGLSMGLLNQALYSTNPPEAFALKLLFTAVTLGFAFKGGEVTPLFVIGACLGNSVGRWLEISPNFFAGLGMVAVFGAAAKTPLACGILAMELFGTPAGMLVCFVAYIVSGRDGIYKQQKHPSKTLTPLEK